MDIYGDIGLRGYVSPMVQKQLEKRDGSWDSIAVYRFFRVPNKWRLFLWGGARNRGAHHQPLFWDGPP